MITIWTPGAPPLRNPNSHLKKQRGHAGLYQHNPFFYIPLQNGGDVWKSLRTHPALLSQRHYGFDVRTMMGETELTLIGDAGIDCILARSFTGTSERFSGAPSDHPGLDAVLSTGEADFGP